MKRVRSQSGFLHVEAIAFKKAFRTRTFFPPRLVVPKCLRSAVVPTASSDCDCCYDARGSLTTIIKKLSSCPHKVSFKAFLVHASISGAVAPTPRQDL
jgi:hypothetical protein